MIKSDNEHLKEALILYLEGKEEEARACFEKHAVELIAIHQANQRIQEAENARK